MIRIGCRAHDYGKHTPVQLAHILHTAGYTGAQLAMPRAIEGIEDFASVTDAQLSAIFQAFDTEDIEITVLSCYMDLSAPDEPTRLAGVENVKRCLRYAKQVGARMVGSETSWTALSDEEKALRRPLMLDSLQRIAEEAVRLDAVFGVEPVAIHPLCSPEILAELLQAVDAPNNIKVIFDPVNLFTTKDAVVPEGVADAVIRLDEYEDILMPLQLIVPLQLFAYYMALQRGCDIDKPRNLAKSVTVE